MEQGRQPFNILKSTELGSVKQSQLSSIQKGTFVDKIPSVKSNWNDQIEIKKAQLATKTFGYGLPGPHSFAIHSVNADSSQTILQPSTDEVYLIDAISITESASSTAAGLLQLSDGSSTVTLFADTSISSGQVDVITWSGDLYLTKDCYLALVLGSGAVTVAVAYSKVVY